MQLLVAFVTFLLVRKQTPTLAEEMSDEAIQISLHHLNQHEQQHLEQEFADYEQRFPQGDD